MQIQESISSVNKRNRGRQTETHHAFTQRAPLYHSSSIYMLLFPEEIYARIHRNHKVLEELPQHHPFFFEKSSVGISFLEATIPLRFRHEIKIIFGLVRRGLGRQRDVNSIMIHLFHHSESSMTAWANPSCMGQAARGLCLGRVRELTRLRADSVSPHVAHTLGARNYHCFTE